MREERLLVKHKKNFTKTTNSMHRYKKHKNLIKDLNVTKPEQVWVSEITYIKTQQGYEYLSLITDYYSKMIVGCHLSTNLKAEGPIKALEMALAGRHYPERDLIHHSDRGFQYCSDDYNNLLNQTDVLISMTQESDPYENAIAERVNGILKDEFGIGEGFMNHIQAVKKISQSIQTYNTKRPHLKCKLKTPLMAHRNPNLKLKRWGRLLKKSQFSTKEKSNKKEKSITY